MRHKPHTIMAEQVKKLLNIHQIEQRTPEWFAARKSMITASEVACCLKLDKATCENYAKQFNLTSFKYSDKCLNPYKSYDNYITDKCKDFFGDLKRRDNSSTLHGKRYEDIALRMYRQQRGVHIYSFGLLQHATYKWLGASPDGITEDGIMLEIKCPKIRKINGVCPIYYYAQVQLQLEVANLQHCDYIECEIEEYSDVQVFRDEFEDTFSGVIMVSDSNVLYPPDDIITLAEFDTWINDSIGSPIYYKIKAHNVIRIQRDTAWFAHVFDSLKDAHEKLVCLQQNKEQYDMIKQEHRNERIRKLHNVVCEL